MPCSRPTRLREHPVRPAESLVPPFVTAVLCAAPLERAGRPAHEAGPVWILCAGPWVGKHPRARAARSRGMDRIPFGWGPSASTKSGKGDTF